MATSPIETVNAYFDAMRAGAEQLDDLIALFASDAVYTEPFSGAERTHEGQEAIAACLRASTASSPPDMTLAVDRVDVDGNLVVTEWTCSSPVFPAPMKGVDRCTVVDGRIQALEVRFKE